MSTVSNWVDFTPATRHPSIRSVEIRQETTTHEGPDLSALQPGESVELLAVPPPSVQATEDQRVHFTNGGTLEDLRNESELLLTRPDGSEARIPGWIDADEEGVRVFVRHSDGDGEWCQTVGPNGTLLQLEGFDGPLQAEVGLDGSLSANARRQGDVLVIDEAQAVNPAVPLDWLTAR